MKTRLLLLTAIFCCLVSTMNAEPKNYSYGSFGATLIYPSIGGGFRWQEDTFGLDLSGSVSVISELRLMALYYPFHKGFYTAVGAGPAFCWEPRRNDNQWIFGTNVLLGSGYEWSGRSEKRRFIQGELGVFNGQEWPLPQLSLRFGLGF